MRSCHLSSSVFYYHQCVCWLSNLKKKIMCGYRLTSQYVSVHQNKNLYSLFVLPAHFLWSALRIQLSINNNILLFIYGCLTWWLNLSRTLIGTCCIAPVDLTNALFYSEVRKSELFTEDSAVALYTRFHLPRRPTVTTVVFQPICHLFLLSTSFFNMGNFLVELCVVLCVGGFPRAATKAGSARCLCTRWMPGKMPTPTCSPRERPATCTRYNVGTCRIIYSLANKGFSVVGSRKACAGEQF